MGWCIADRRDRPAARPHPLLQAGAGAHRRQRHGRLLAPPRGPRPWRRRPRPSSCWSGTPSPTPPTGGWACTGWRRAPTSTTSPPSGCCERAGFTRIGTEHAMMAHDDGATDRRRAVRAARPGRPPPRRRSRRWCSRGRGCGCARGARADEDRVVQACTDPVTRHWLGGACPRRTPSTRPRLPARPGRGPARGVGALLVRGGPGDRRVPRGGVGDAPAGGGRHRRRGRLLGPPAGTRPRRHCPRRSGWPCATPSCRPPTAAWGDAGCGSTSPTATSPSQRVALRGGFVEVGRDRLAERLGDGSYVDLVRHDLLESEYAAR